MSHRFQLEAENERLLLKVEELKEICSLTSSLNVKHKFQLEKETNEKDALKEANHKLKLKLNNLTTKCNEQEQKIKVLESNLRRKPETNVSRVQIVKSIYDITASSEKALISLQKRYDELEAEHHDALSVIDDLEFELGDIDYLETEMRKLQKENTSLKNIISTSRSCTTSDKIGDSTVMVNVKKDDEEAQTKLSRAYELQSIKERKMVVQQKLEQFHQHHQHSTLHTKTMPDMAT